MFARSALVLAFVAGCASSAPAVSVRTENACASCHAVEHAQWSTSAHARAARTPAFTASLARSSTRAWCLGCHAPARDGARGIGCTECHASRTGHGAGAVACARCHEFPDLDGAMAQRTASEHAASPLASVSCAQCHARTHAFTVERAVRASVVHANADELVVEVRVGDTGHLVPTGDPFRALELRACPSESDCTEPIATRRLPRLASGSTSTHILPVEPEARAWQLVMHLVEPALDVPVGVRERVIAHGVLP